MEAELRDFLEGMEGRLGAEIRSGDDEVRRGVDAQGRALREDMQAMEARLVASTRERRDEIDAAAKDTGSLKRRVAAWRSA